MSKQILWFVLVFSVFSFAEKNFDEARAEFVNSPKNGAEVARWSEPYDETYLPYGVCGEVKDFSIVKLEERVKYYYDHAPHFYSDHFYALFSVVRVTYNVTCKNKLQYKGESYLVSDRKLLEDDISLSDSKRDEFKAHAHGWREKPLNYLSEKGVFFDSTSDFRFENYARFNQDSLKEAWVRQKVSSVFDKTVCGIALVDSEGNVIFGKIPSVAECKSYNGPNLLVEYVLGGSR